MTCGSWGRSPWWSPSRVLACSGPEKGRCRGRSSVFTVTGPDAIVDCVLVELRDQVDPAIVVDARPGLVQRDGDVVGTDGVSPCISRFRPVTTMWPSGTGTIWDA